MRISDVQSQAGEKELARRKPIKEDSIADAYSARVGYGTTKKRGSIHARNCGLICEFQVQTEKNHGIGERNAL